MTYDLSTVFLLIALAVASISDLRRHRIPNWLTFGTLVVGLCLQSLYLGSDGLIASMSGAGVGLAIFLPFFLMGGMGAGDVKLTAAIGSFIGALPVIFAAALSVLLASVYALFLIALNRELGTTYRRYVVSMVCKTWVASEEASITRKKFPFALAITGGTVLSLAWYSQLEFYHLTTELSYLWQLWRAGQ